MMRQKRARIPSPPSRHLSSFEQVLNEDLMKPARKKPRGIKLSEEDGMIKARLKKDFRQATVAVVDGKRYVRLCDWGNQAAETLVRANLKELIARAKEVGKRMLKEKDGGLLEERCLDPIGGISRAGLVDSKGGKLKANGRAAYEMIKQFFKDRQMMEKLARHAIEEYRKESR
ncbi:MAG: hypothetical protein N3F07_01405 [Candidatus Micrarchaeota archaeon]|nr:hypothetical protein [Candidatus Micrarchaeota archaeon]